MKANVYFERIVDAANELHDAICKLQNSGEVDEIKCSYFVMKADDLREELFYFRDEIESEAPIDEK